MRRLVGKLNFVFTLLLIGVALYFFNTLFSVPGCENLKRVSKNTDLIDKFWESIVHKFEDKTELKALDGEIGPIQASEVADRFTLDWGSLNIPNEVATFDIIGKNFTYSAPDLFAVDRIYIGHNYVANLVFKLHHRGDGSQDISSISYDVRLECRSR